MFKRKYFRIGYVVIALAAIATLGFTQCQSRADSGTAGTAPSKTAAESAAVAPQPNLNWETAIARVAKKVLPAVVHINVTERREVSSPMGPFSNDPFFHFFFNGRQMPRKFKQELRALGTGMIMDQKGDILTNNHVVAGATEISVVMADGRSYPAKVVGTDPKTDLAVIRIKVHRKLPTVTFGDSDKMQVGDWVVAIGEPRGLDQTVTHGIISAKHRRGVTNPTSYQDYLQTDAAINPGNSGGPLLNLKGHVIGINSAIETTSGGFQGIGFAIPSDMAVYVAHQLIAHGKVTRGWLGVSIHDLTPAQVRSMHLNSKTGALVADVVKDSPAGKAGLKKNDLIIKYNGQKVADSAALQSLVGDTRPGDKVNMTVLRNGKTVNLTVKIGNMEDAMKRIAASVKDRLGVVIRPLTADESQRYGLEPGQGVAIASLTKDSVLGKAGFEKNDVIVSINNVPVEGVDGFVSLIKALPAHAQVVLKAVDHRTGESGYVQVTIG
jgi:serine protease Do